MATQIVNLFAAHASGGEYGPAGVYTVIHSSSTSTLFVWQLGNSAWGGLLANHTFSYDTATKIWADVGSGNPAYVCDGSTWANTTASSANQQTLSFWQSSTSRNFNLTNPYYNSAAVNVPYVTWYFPDFVCGQNTYVGVTHTVAQSSSTTYYVHELGVGQIGTIIVGTGAYPSNFGSANFGFTISDRTIQVINPGGAMIGQKVFSCGKKKVHANFW
jgi:hypothetical protein